MPSARQSTTFTHFGEKKLSQIIAARNCHHHCRHCLFGYQWFLALLMAETAKTMVRWSMSLINLHKRYFERRPASPLVPSRHMKLSLDDLKALQEHIKDWLRPKDLKKIAGGNATNMIDVFAMKLSTPSSSWSALFPLAFHFCLRMSLRNKLCFQSLRGGTKMYFWLLPAVLSIATLIDGCHYTDIVVRFEPH